MQIYVCQITSEHKTCCLAISSVYYGSWCLSRTEGILTQEACGAELIIQRNFGSLKLLVLKFLIVFVHCE